LTGGRVGSVCAKAQRHTRSERAISLSVIEVFI
jgi:hypothetical protein